MKHVYSLDEFEQALSFVKEREDAIRTALAGVRNNTRVYHSWEALIPEPCAVTLEKLKSLQDVITPLHALFFNEHKGEQLLAPFYLTKTACLFDVSLTRSALEGVCLDVASYRSHAASLSREHLHERMQIRRKLEELDTSVMKMLVSCSQWRTKAMQYHQEVSQQKTTSSLDRRRHLRLVTMNATNTRGEKSHDAFL